MKTTQRVVALLLGVMLVAVSSLHAQTVTKVGTTAAKFLSIPVGARATAMGGAFTGIVDDATSMYWNAAGAARLYQSEAVFTHINWIADIDFNYGGVVVPLGELGVIGASVTALTMPEMERTTEEQPEGTGQTFTAGSYAIGLAYARNLTDWFSLGVNVKYINEHIWNSTASGLALDIGTLFNTPFSGLKFGVGISNFGQKLKITGDDLLVQKDLSPNEGNNANVNAVLATEGFDIPLNLRLGFAYEPIADDDQLLVLAADFSHPNDNAENIVVGAEYSLFQRIVSIRAGYRGFGKVFPNWLDKETEEGLTLGAGLRYRFAGDLAIKADYAYQQFGRLNDVHQFGVALQF